MKNIYSLNKNILNTEVQDFINQNLNSDISKLLFKGSPFDGVSIKELAEQIEAKKRSQQKLPTWFKSKNIYYPNKLNIEQTSSEITAKYKANLISGDSIIDLTGGFGVDCFAFSDRFKNVTHCEINTTLSGVAKHNFKVLDKNNIDCITNDGIEFLQKNKQQYDWIYIDPSRRNDSKGKVFLLKDCLPNVPENLDLLFEYTNNILIKASPILDITSAINKLNFVKEVHTIAIHNEVKEVIYLLEKNYQDKVDYKTINIKKEEKQIFNFNQTVQEVNYSAPSNYLYEPNAAILKAGAFSEISTQLKIDKLHKHSHLYTSENLINFPGRRFHINYISSYDKKLLHKLIPEKKANITTRNFPVTVAQIRKKTGLKDGGDTYLFFTKTIDEKYVALICKKV